MKLSLFFRALIRNTSAERQRREHLKAGRIEYQERLSVPFTDEAAVGRRLFSSYLRNLWGLWADTRRSIIQPWSANELTE